MVLWHYYLNCCFLTLFPPPQIWPWLRPYWAPMTFGGAMQCHSLRDWAWSLGLILSLSQATRAPIGPAMCRRDRPQVYGIGILTGQVEGPFPKKDWELGRALLPLLAVICCMSWLPLSDSFFSNTLDASAPHGGHHHVHLAKSSSKSGQGQYYPW